MGVGASLEQVAAVARSIASSVRTMGVALSPCTIPEVGVPSFSLGPKEIGFGIGSISVPFDFSKVVRSSFFVITSALFFAQLF